MMTLGSTPPRTLTVSVAGSTHRLEARLTRAAARDPLAVIAPPHPSYGGTIDSPVVRTMERQLQQRGLATLAFNFRGTGESEGEQTGSYDEARTDYLAVARALPDATLTWLCGYSFGGVAALAAALELGVARVLMVAPPLGMLDPELLARFEGRLAVIVGSADEYAPVAAVHALFGPRARTTLAILPDVEHFFLGSAVQRLSDGLTRLLDQAAADEQTHAH